ncbi:MAG: lysophospholipase [Candidatus Omnitrophica bacterium]|nr:lysophospholipase [Candidatus Omnitrophota bacterium]
MSTIATDEGFFQTAAGRKLFYRMWQPTPCKALVVIAHGFGEHGGRYSKLAQTLAQRQLAVACADLWGHGRSDGRRGDIERFGQYVDDLDALAAELFLPRSQQKGVALFGHSFGALVAIHWALRNPQTLRSLILQSPLLKVGFPVPQWKIRLADITRRYWPTLALSNSLDPRWLSHDPAVVQQYRDDPLVHHRITLRAYEALQGAMQQGREQAARVDTPTLVLYGLADQVVSVTACQHFAAQLVCEKRIVEFPDCYHELHHEPALPHVLEELSGWVDAHPPRP